MLKYIKRFLPHLLVLIGFVVLSLAYFSPVLKGKEIFQSDIMHHVGMAQQQKDFAKTEGEQTFWTNSAFGGMPTYLLGARYPNNYIKKLDLAIRFLPRPADYMFLYFIGFYILLLSLKVDYKLAALGAVAFGFSTYMLIILGVGHNSKAHAIAYMPLVMSGIILTFRKKYLLGFGLTTIGLGLQIVANHFQMTYYLLITVLVMGVAYLIYFYKRKDLQTFFKSIAVMVVAAVLAVGLNATSMLATQDYVNESTRGKSPITINPDGTPKESSGLSRAYITQYSYGILETFNLFIPNFMGGGTYEDLGKDSETYKAYLNLGASPIEAINAVKQSPTYWGEQPIVEGPAYIGAVVIFLFVFCLFLLKGRLKWWAVGASVIALLLSYGKNFGLLTNFFIDYVPLYNKFRAVSSIQVIIEICLPILAVFGLVKLFDKSVERKTKEKALLYSLGITGGVSILFLLFKSLLFDFTGAIDLGYKNAYGSPFVEALVKDRKVLFTEDTLRTLIFVIIAAGLVFYYLKNKINRNITIIAFAILILADLVMIGKRYVNEDNFVSSRRVSQPYLANKADKQIMMDKSHFRVLDLTEESQNMPAKASYFHNSILGYHAAKPGRFNELLDFYIYNQNLNVLNMLNTKYIIKNTNEEGPIPLLNSQANGNAWFISKLKVVENGNEDIKALDTLENKNVATVRQSIFNTIENKSKSFEVDSSAKIKLEDYKSNNLVYKTENSKNGFAVFSEIYYKNGWNAYLDGKHVPHYRVDYLLRGMPIPKGEHRIEFKFEPKLVETGSKVAIASSIGFVLLFGLGLFFKFRRKE